MFIHNSVNGTARICLNSGLGVFVNTFTLGLAQCRINLKKFQGVPSLSGGQIGGRNIKNYHLIQ
jgi:hypothetical protein